MYEININVVSDIYGIFLEGFELHWNEHYVDVFFSIPKYEKPIDEEYLVDMAKNDFKTFGKRICDKRIF